MNIPKGRYVRRLFIALVSMSLVLLSLVQLALVPLISGQAVQMVPILNDVLTGLLTSLIGASIVAFTIYWLLPEVELKNEVDVVPGADRSDSLEQMRKEATFWWFSGGLGRSNRIVSLPELAARSRRSNRSISIVLIILDPNNLELCKYYAQHRAGRRSGQNQPWSPRYVRQELIATSLASAIWTEKSPLINIEVRFKSYCGIYRFEVTDKSAIRTSEDLLDPAEAFPYNTRSYSNAREHLRMERDQATLFVPAPHYVASNLDSSTLPKWLEASQISSDGLDTEDFDAIFKLLENQIDPYS